MSRTTDEILAGILIHPENDDLRLEYADRIQETDPGWARFIRRSISRVVYPSDVLKARLQLPFKKYDVSCIYRRGFADTLMSTPEDFLEHGQALLDLGPIVEVLLHVPGSTIRDTWNTYLPSLAEYPTLARVRHLTFWGDLTFDCASLHHLINSRFTDSLLMMNASCFVSADDPLEEEAMWAALFESPVFCRMIDWGFTRRVSVDVAPMDQVDVTRMRTKRQIGDRMRVEKPRNQYYETTSYDPMPAEDRAIEKKYGYIPRLHASNWGATVIDVLRGNKPDFPAGAPVTEAMYAVSPTVERKVASDY